MTDALLVSAGPVFTVEGTRRGEFARDVLRLEVRHDTQGLRTLKLRLLAIGPREGEETEGLLYLDGDIIGFGSRIEVSLGPPERARTVFRGAVSAIEASFHEEREPHVLLFAEDELMQLRMTRRVRSYEEVTDAEIARRIASEHGLVARVDADGPTHDVVHQWNMSDLAFLRERADRIQAELWVDDRALHFQERERRAGEEIVLVQGNHLLAADLRADLAHQRTGATVSGYDAHRRDSIREEAGEEVVQAEIAGGTTGPGILERAFGSLPSHRVRDVPLRRGEAGSWARAEMLRRSRQFVTISGTTRGTPGMDAGSRLTLERVGSPFDGGGYRVTRVCHTYDLTSGYRTHFEAERPVMTGRI